MARKKYMYLLERIRDGATYRKGERIWADSHCTGWRVIERLEIR